MVTIPGWFVRYGFPALALGLVTVAALAARATVHGDASARPASSPAPIVERAKPKPRTKGARAALYSVRSGDTLAVIAERYGTSVDRLMELNPGIDPQALRVGQSVRVD